MDIEFTPKQTSAMNALQSEKYNFILYGGAIRGGKTWFGLSALLVLCEVFKKSRWCVIRENTERIRITTIPSFNKLNARGKLKSNPYEYVHHNGSIILFKGENYAIDKDLDWMKGLEVNGFLFEEINECQQQTLNKAFERAGSWNIKPMPKPIILATCNPTFQWVKELIYDRWKLNQLPKTWLYIPAKITDNPHLSLDYIESLKNLPRWEYEVFVEGNWDVQLQTGSEFYKEFRVDKHVKNINIDLDSYIHVSIDSNVFPYISLSIYQLCKIYDNWIIKQIHELPCIDPNNTASKAGEVFSKWLKSVGYKLNKVYVYGDSSTKSRNNIDDNKRSFFDIFVNTIKKYNFEIVDRMIGKSPSVSAIGDFVNAIFEGVVKGIEININESCKKTINDFIETKQDKDGTILKKRITDSKTGISYEPNGHIVDNLKDFIYQAFTQEFNNYQNRFKPFEVGGAKQVLRGSILTP